MLAVIFEILGSLGLFLFGMKVMSEALQKVSGERLRALIRSVTQNRLSGVITGTLVTLLVQSSSATTVMIVSFVNAQMLSLLQAIGLIMGANLGTTGTFWLVSALGFKVSLSDLALPIMGVGLPMLFLKSARVRDIGEVLIGFGLLFLGLGFLKDSVPDIQSHPEMLAFLADYTGLGFASVMLFFLVGVILTVVVQSSSVAGAITLAMAYKGWIDYPSAAAIVLGENVGTTITANLAAIGAGGEARRAALAHTLFNVSGVLWILALFGPFTRGVDWLMPGSVADATALPIHLAAFHTLFNFTNICLQIGFVSWIAKAVRRIVPGDEAREHHLERLSSFPRLFPQTGELDLAEAERETMRMAQLTKSMFQGFIEVVENPERDMGAKVKELKRMEELSDQAAHEITEYLIQCSNARLSETSTGNVAAMLQVVDEMEDICDCCYRLVLLAERNYRKQRPFPPEVRRELHFFAEQVLQFIEFYGRHLIQPVSAAELEIAYQLENSIDESRKRLRRDAVMRMQNAGNVKRELLYIDILSNIEKIGNHSLNILQALQERR